MPTLIKRQIFFISLLAALFITVASCNSKSTDDESQIAVTPSIVAVKSFSFLSNAKVLENLDSVFFSIDLKTGVIFNAIYLPVGTDLTRIVPSVTFVNSMSKAEFTYLKDDKEMVTSDYLTNPGDSIDFTYPVNFNVTAADGTSSFSYQIKVNVYSQDSDALLWNRLEVSTLPYRFDNPLAQKTLMKDDTAYCLVAESNGEFTLSTCSNLNEGNWLQSQFSPSFTPSVGSFTATADAFYLLDVDGELFSSPDLISWQDTGESWISLIGSYGTSVVGVESAGPELLYAQYPQSPEFQPGVIDPDFPISEISGLGLIESKWSPLPTAIFAGGVTEDGNVNSSVWAFDGINWAYINNTTLPALISPMLSRYVVYRATTAAFKVREFDVWLLFGGTLESGEMNRKVFLSYDNGVNWQEAPELMQLPDFIPSLEGSDVVTAGYPLTADLADAWQRVEETKSRVSYEIEGTDITWICPYLYIFGGYLQSSGESLNTTIYRGVLDRLTMAPVI